MMRGLPKHKHRPSKKAWRIMYGDEFSAVGAQGSNFHGYCQFTGTHLVIDICRCGARLYFCPPTGRRKWVGGDPLWRDSAR